MPDYTKNYKIEKPYQDEYFNIDIWCANMDIIDDAIKKAASNGGINTSINADGNIVIEKADGTQLELNFLPLTGGAVNGNLAIGIIDDKSVYKNKFNCRWGLIVGSKNEIGDVGQSNGVGAAIGTNNNVGGQCAAAIGNGNFVDSLSSLALGDANKIIRGANHSFAMGVGNEIKGTLAACIGGDLLVNNSDLTNLVIGSKNSPNSNSLFIIGNSYFSSTRSNCFRVTDTGITYTANSYNTGGADYAEYFEWLDKNIDNEDRRGYFVTLDGDKIVKANSSDDYILGVVSAHPTVIGNADMEYAYKFLYDDFGSPIYEEIEEINTKTKQITKRLVQKLNPLFDSTKEHIERRFRKEWSAIGMLGVLTVRDDGTCKVNGFCQVTKGGIATNSNKGYRVIKRVAKNIIKIVFK